MKSLEVIGVRAKLGLLLGQWLRQSRLFDSTVPRFESRHFLSLRLTKKLMKMKKTRPELPSLKNSYVSAFKEFPETIVEGEKQHFGVGLIFVCQSQTQN